MHWTELPEFKDYGPSWASWGSCWLWAVREGGLPWWKRWTLSLAGFTEQILSNVESQVRNHCSLLCPSERYQDPWGMAQAASLLSKKPLAWTLKYCVAGTGTHSFELVSQIWSSQSPFSVSEVFCRGGKILHEGDIIKMPKLANTYETIASEGADAFYTGSLAKQIIEDIRSVGEKRHLSETAWVSWLLQLSIQGEASDLQKPWKWVKLAAWNATSETCGNRTPKRSH